MTNDELLDLIRRGTEVDDLALVSRRPYPYATSAPLDELVVRIDGQETSLILKDLARQRLLGDAQRTKPEWCYEPRREIDSYRFVLGGAGFGPRLYGADHERLVIEKVDGVELWQVGQLDVWEGVAVWLAEFHRYFAARVDKVRVANPFLLDLGVGWFDGWAARAAVALDRSHDERAPELVAAIKRYAQASSRLAALPRTFIHGELYPSNVLVTQAGRVKPVDWEMAGVGPALVDLAALTAGWGAHERERLIGAYESAGPPAGVDRADLDLCRLHLALQWIGWAPDWQAPAAHAHDWVDEALALAGHVGMQ